MVVDEQQRSGVLHGLHCGAYLARDGRRVVTFEAQLHRRHAGLRHAAHPLGIGQYGVETQVLRAGCKGVRMGARLQSEVCGLVGPLRRVEPAGAPRLRSPGTGQAVCVMGDETQGAAGRKGCVVHGIFQGCRRHRLGREVRKRRRMVLADGLLHGGCRRQWRGGLRHAQPCAWCQNGVPSTGVLGCAASCGVIAPAMRAARPAATASAKAPAICTGSVARATAVLSSTPS